MGVLQNNLVYHQCAVFCTSAASELGPGTLQKSLPTVHELRNVLDLTETHHHNYAHG